MLLGVDYYPEQWDDKLLDEDLDRICELGCNVIRIGEFAWHLMEKSEGEYNFSYFDRVIERAKSKGLKIIFGTPTATPPAWLIKKHPEILPEFADGAKKSFGGRHTYCFSSQTYMDYCKKIIEKLVSHYKDEKAIVAWQIDNELGHEGSDVCWCEKCRNKFDAYLAQKFGGDIDKLNNTYGTRFWSQEYNSFDEIPLPNRTITTHNPSLRLDFERFCSKNIVDFAKMQNEIIKSIIPDAVVMHDFPGGGLDKSVDYSEVSNHIDKVAYNNYPVWGRQMTPILPHEIAFSLDYIRGLKGQNFWITEAIMGAQGHDVTGYLPRPKQAQMWSYQSVARGGDGLMYFRYRGATKGAEQYCYGVIDADNVPRRKYYEVKEFFENIKNYADILDTPFESQVCMLYDFDSLASMRIQRQSALFDSQGEMKKIYKAFYDRNVKVDIIPCDRDIDKYKIVVIPNMTVSSPQFVKKIKDFASGGGVVIMTYRSAVKNKDNNLTFGKVVPVDFDDLIGGYVEETESVDKPDSFVCIGENNKQGKEGKAGVFRDMLVATQGKSLYHYGDQFYSQYSAVLENKYGQGRAYYIGTSLDENLLGDMVEDILCKQNIPVIKTPEGIEVVLRGNHDKKVVFIINHNPCKVKYKDLVLAPFETKIVD